MGSEVTHRKALTTAYRFLARRSYSQEELKTKLLRKGFAPEVTEKVIKHAVQEGCLNDEEVSLRWAASLIEHKCWGRDKIAVYLHAKGIPQPTIDRVQKTLWHDQDEGAVARKALSKHFDRSEKVPSVAQKVRFLKSRGFPFDIIYRVINNSAIID